MKRIYKVFNNLVEMYDDNKALHPPKEDKDVEFSLKGIGMYDKYMEFEKKHHDEREKLKDLWL